MRMYATTLARYARTVYLARRVDLGAEAADNILRAVQHLDDWACESLRFEDLDEDTFCRYLRHRLLSVKPSTCNAELAKIMTLWRFAHERGEAPPPLRKVPRLRTAHHSPDAWTRDELRQLLDTVEQDSRQDYWRSLVYTVLDTSLRISSVRRVRPDEIRLGDNLLLARAMPARKQHRDQWFRLAPQVVEAIARVWRPGAAKVWTGSRQWQFYHFKKIVKASGVPYKSDQSRQLFHKLRRTAITLTVATQGLAAAAEKAGHASTRMTLRFYVDPSQSPSPSILEAAGIF